MRPAVFDDEEDAPPLASELLQRAAFRPRVGLTAVDASTLGLDASVIDYDGYVERKNVEAEKSAGLGKVGGGGGQARYIGGLVAKAEERKKALEEVHERKLAREREAEGAMYGDKETFVTSSYAATLELRKADAEREARTSAEEELGATKGGMSGIYRSMLFGGGAASGAPTGHAAVQQQRVPLMQMAPQKVTQSLASEQPLESKAARVPPPHEAQREPHSVEAKSLPPLEASHKSGSTSPQNPVRFQGSTLAEVEEARKRALERYSARAASNLL